MKKLILAVMALTMSATAMAQGEETKQDNNQRRKFDRTEMIKRRTDETAKQLGLNEEQTAKLLELNTQYADKMGPQMRGNRRPQGRRPGGEMGQNQPPRRLEGRLQMSSEEREKMRKEMEINRAAYDAELQKILTEEQFTKYQAEEKKRMEQRRPQMYQRGDRQQGFQRADRQKLQSEERSQAADDNKE